MSFVIEHDEWNHQPHRLPKDSKIKMGEIYGVDPYDGRRDPSGRSSWAQKVFFAYKTPANDWRPKLAKTESVAEAAVAIQALMSPDIYDVGFQPLTVNFKDETGKNTPYTHDLLLTFQTGHRRLVFVRYERSLRKPATERAIQAILDATPRAAADDMIVVNAGDYTRQRRDNLFRMFKLCATPDEEADAIVLRTMHVHRSIYVMNDLFPRAGIEQSRVFQACYRLIAARKLIANLDHVIWEHSRIGLMG